MFIVTGGAGFIGSNIVHALNAEGETGIIVVDDLKDGRKFRNIATARIADFIDRDDFRALVRDGRDFGKVEGIFHQGACTDTTEWNGRYMLDVNFTASKELFAWSEQRRIRLVYASSGAVSSEAMLLSLERPSSSVTTLGSPPQPTITKPRSARLTARPFRTTMPIR